MRVKFEIDSDNNINILDQDQEDTLVRIKSEDGVTVVTVTASNVDEVIREPMSFEEDNYGEDI